LMKVFPARFGKTVKTNVFQPVSANFSDDF